MKKILVIEDDSSTRVGLAGALRRHGYEVTEAADGTAGLAAAFQRPPDIILCDVNVPGPNGLEILKELRNRPETTAVPVVLMTGQPGKSGVRESMNLGADDYLAKPFSLEQMLATLAARLKRREGMQQALEAQVQAERLSAAEKLRLQTSALHATVNSIVITDRQGKILWVNPAFTRLTGYTAEEVLGQTARLLKSGRHTQQFYAELWKTIAAGNSWHGELINKRKDGTCYHEDMTITPVPGENGAIQNFIAIKQDISESKRIKKALDYKHDLLQALMDNLPDYIYFKDSACRFTLINRAYASHLGLSDPEQAVGKFDADLLPLREARQKLVDDRRLLATGEPILGQAEKCEASHGPAWVSTTKIPLRDIDGGIDGLVGISRDITKAKLAEEELQRKTAFLEAQINSSIDGILVVDEQGRKVLQNQRTTELLKIPSAIAELADDQAQLRWVTEHAQHPAQFLARVQELNVHPERSCRDEIEMNDGTILDRYSAPMLGKNGVYYGRLWTFRDITERKHMELSLRQSEEKFHGFLENSRDAIMALDPPTGQFTSANPAAVKLFGVKSEREMIGLTPAAFSPERQPDGRLSAELAARKIAGQGSQHFEWAHRRRNGQEFNAEVLLTRIEQGGKPLILATIRDITGRKRAQERLRESEEKFRQLANNVSDVFWITSPEFQQFHFVNSAFERIWGRPLSSLLTDPRQWQDAIVPEDRERFQAGLKRLQSGQTEVSTEFRVARPDGSIRWVHNRGFQVPDATGKIVRLAGIASDITERKRLETELFQARKLESIGQLAAGIAHEINTPTQYVGDNTRFIKESFGAVVKVLESHEALLTAAKTGGITPELLAHTEEVLAAADLEYLRSQIPQALAETLEGVERVAKIVRAMKEFSHPGGREKAPADLNRAIESTVTVARNEWKYVADMKLDLDPCLPFVPCYLGEFNQIILNLVVNAAHAIGDVIKNTPGVKGHITIQTRPLGDQVEIRIIDTGTGIAEANRTKIFEPFFTTKDVGRGTGQGLTMVYGSVVNRHGGTVSFETELGRGSTFIIRLPLKPAREPVAAQPARVGTSPV